MADSVKEWTAHRNPDDTWEVRGSDAYGSIVIAQIDVRLDNPAVIAHLIAAAPKLLAACEMALDDLIDILQLDKDGNDTDGNDYAVWFRLTEVIAAAKGE